MRNVLHIDVDKFCWCCRLESQCAVLNAVTVFPVEQAKCLAHRQEVNGPHCFWSRNCLNCTLTKFAFRLDHRASNDSERFPSAPIGSNRLRSTPISFDRNVWMFSMYITDWKHHWNGQIFERFKIPIGSWCRQIGRPQIDSGSEF